MLRIGEVELDVHIKLVPHAFESVSLIALVVLLLNYNMNEYFLNVISWCVVNVIDN